MSLPVVGFVGLGRMGGPMAGRLVDAGYSVVGFDAAGTAGRLSEGARAAESIEALAAEAEVVCLSVPDGAASEAVCAQLVTAPHRRVKAVANLSTIGSAAAQRCEQILRAAQIEYLDAPVSGGVKGAQNGTLTLMVGGDAALFERLQPLLQVFGHRCVLVGPRVGQGQAMKLLNNYCSAAAMAATAEAVVFGARLGLDLGQMVDVLNVSTGRSMASAEKFPRSVVTRSYDFGFAGALMAKDVALYLESATETGAPRDVADAVDRLWREFDRANPGADFTRIHKYLEDRADL